MVRGLPPIHCVATSRRTGNQCGNWAIPGGTQCRNHLGHTAKNMAKADERLTLQLLLRQDPRPVWQVVLDATHTLDALARDAKAKLLEGEEVTVEQLDRLLELTSHQHRLASTAITT